jgi:hypothetical protein
LLAVIRSESISFGSFGSLLNDMRNANFPSGETSLIFSNAGGS